jgi:hypothetical protein
LDELIVVGSDNEGFAVIDIQVICELLLVEEVS